MSGEGLVEAREREGVVLGEGVKVFEGGRRRRTRRRRRRGDMSQMSDGSSDRFVSV